jgi:hypothetical protein
LVLLYFGVGVGVASYFGVVSFGVGVCCGVIEVHCLTGAPNTGAEYG